MERALSVLIPTLMLVGLVVRPLVLVDEEHKIEVVERTKSK